MRSGLLTITAKGSIGSKFALKMPQQYLFKSWSSEMLCPEAMADVGPPEVQKAVAVLTNPLESSEWHVMDPFTHAAASRVLRH